MPLTYPVLRTDSLSIRERSLEIRVWLPWMRSLPWTCITDVAVEIDGRALEGGVAVFDDVEIPLRAIVELPGYWMVGTSLAVRVPHAPASVGERPVRVRVTAAIPYIYSDSGPLTVTSTGEATLNDAGEASPVTEARQMQSQSLIDK
ncbi:MAG: hypothetical protein ACTHNQ_15330 [Microbacterium sp.]|uniref:hypothetical protein n=1 Tax=Microbacterium sp. TaxID=51671 RepID=UPI003F8101D1